jgi:hypothetical protein
LLGNNGGGGMLRRVGAMSRGQGERVGGPHGVVVWAQARVTLMC